MITPVSNLQLQITRKPTETSVSKTQAVNNSTTANDGNTGASESNGGVCDGGDTDPHAERPSLVIPMVYDVNANITQLAERRDATGTIASSATNTASQLLRRFAEQHKANAAATGECTIFPAIRELLTNYVMPVESTAAAAATTTAATAATTTTTTTTTNGSAEQRQTTAATAMPTVSITTTTTSAAAAANSTPTPATTADTAALAPSTVDQQTQQSQQPAQQKPVPSQVKLIRQVFVIK